MTEPGVATVIYALALVAFLAALALSLVGRAGAAVAGAIGLCLLTLGHMV